jgi:pimeloyl-ACP methyl ester carboxylesterase
VSTAEPLGVPMPQSPAPRPRRRWLPWLVPAVLLLLAAAALALDHWLPYMLLAHYKFGVEAHPRILDDYGAAAEDIGFTTSDGVKIRGWFIPARAAANDGRLPDFWLRRGLAKAERLADFRVDEVSPERQIRAVGCPTLIAHGTADRYVPFSDAKRLYAAAGSPRKEIYEIDGADHGTMFRLGGDRLRERIARMVREGCAPGGAVDNRATGPAGKPGPGN